MPLEDIPRLYAVDPQTGLALVRHRHPDVVVPTWREPVMTPNCTVGQADDLRSIAIIDWLTCLVVNAGVAPSHSAVKVALAGAKVSPNDAPVAASTRINDGDRLVANLLARRASGP